MIQLSWKWDDGPPSHSSNIFIHKLLISLKIFHQKWACPYRFSTLHQSNNTSPGRHCTWPGFYMTIVLHPVYSFAAGVILPPASTNRWAIPVMPPTAQHCGRVDLILHQSTHHGTKLFILEHQFSPYVYILTIIFVSSLYILYPHKDNINKKHSQLRPDLYGLKSLARDTTILNCVAQLWAFTPCNS